MNKFLNFLSANWFKLSIIIIAFFYVLVLFFNFYLDGKKHNLNVYEDSMKWCFDLFGNDKSSDYICIAGINRYYLNKDFFISNKAQKTYEREKAFWKCYSSEWAKDGTRGLGEEAISKKCSEQVNK